MARFAGTELSGYFNSPDFTGLGRTMMQGASLQRNAANAAVGKTKVAGIGAVGAVKGYQFDADAMRAEGAAQAQGMRNDGMLGLVSGIAGGIATRAAGGFGARGKGGGGVLPQTTEYDIYGPWGSLPGEH